MRRIFTLLLAGTMSLVLMGCGGNNPLPTRTDPGHTDTVTTHQANN